MPVPLHFMTGGVCSCGNPHRQLDHDVRQGGKHPLHKSWQETDYREWWQWVEGSDVYNVGIATGRPSGHWVLDYDPTHPEATVPGGAAEVAARLQNESIAAHVLTGSRGLHWRFAMPADGSDVTNQRGRLPKGLDVRGTGGQVVAPPSVSGKGAYVELIDATPYVAPDWLVGLIRPESATSARRVENGTLPAGSDRAQRYARAALKAECESHSRLDDGRRGDLAWAFACRCVELLNLGRFSEHEVASMFATAIVMARENAPGGLADGEAHRLWERALAEVGDRAAVLPEHDPLVPPPLPPEVAAPFSSAPDHGASGNSGQTTDSNTESRTMETGIPPLPSFSVPGSAGGASGAAPAPPSNAGASGGAPSAWDAAVDAEVSKLAVREAARRKWEGLRLGRRAPLASELIRADELDQIADPVPLVEGMFYVDSLARINGRPGQGKSFVAVDLAGCVASGTAWAGRPVRRGSVLMVVAEGLSGMKRRIRAWETEHKIKLGGDLVLMRRPVMVDGPEWTEFVAMAASLDPALIIIDTQARVSVGLKENDSTDMGLLVNGLELLRGATGACVLLVHHAGKADDGGRGSNAVEGAMTSEFGVSRAGASVTVKVTKQKDAPEAGPVLFDLRSVTLMRETAGGFLTPDGEPAAVLAWRAPVEVEPGAPVVDVGAQRMRALWQAMHDNLASGEGATRAEIKSLWLATPAMAGVSRTAAINAWVRAWNGLIDLGLIARNDRMSSRFRLIVLSDQSADGVLTSNKTDSPTLPPEGFSPWLFDDDPHGKKDHG
jgi:hypothetical protein